MSKSFPLLMVGAALFALAALAATPAITAANPQAVLRPDPLSLGLRSGGQGSLSIRVDNVESMYGFEFHLRFDPQLVQVVDADASKPGVQLKPGDWLKGGFVAVNKADNTAGTIDYAATLLNPAPPVSGGGIAATITFQAKKDGTSPLKVVSAILASREGKEIQSQWEDGAIGVSAQGQAPEVKPVVGAAGQPSSGATGSSAPAAITVDTRLLVGAAAVGVLAFVGALGLVALILVFRRKP